MRSQVSRTARSAALVAAVALLASCASTRLAEYQFAGESIRVSVQATPQSRVNASYDLDIDLDDPVSTIVSIGSSMAKASQVAVAEQKLRAASRRIDIESVIQNEISLFYEDVMGMRVTAGPGRAEYALRIEVEEYGIRAGSVGSGVSFSLRGVAELYDTYLGTRIWRKRFYESEAVTPSFFGLPGAAGNVVSAAMLAELSEDRIVRGMERLARDAAWELSRRFERDLYRARRNL